MAERIQGGLPRLRRWLVALGLAGLCGTVVAEPTVVLTSPADQSVIAKGTSITLTATASVDAGNRINKIEFYDGTKRLGRDGGSPPYSMDWTGSLGTHTLTAKVTGNKGISATSAPVTVVVANPPTVSLSSPATGTVFTAPAAITLTASAADTDGSVAKVEFYAGTSLVGTATTAPYSVAWTAVPAGSYTLIAKATDNVGLTSTSSAVALLVNAPPTVILSSPTANAVTAPGGTVTLMATASDADGSVAKVEFYVGATLLGTATTAPYAVAWSGMALGNYTLTAKATDDRGASTMSAAVPVRVAGGAVYYLHSDHLETPRLATDGQGRAVWRRRPLDEPFGLSPAETDPDGDGVAFELNLRFPGQYFDKESNLAYNYYRDYDPATGRYRQSDPIGLQGGINTYLYVEGNPLSLTDPLGLQAVPMPPPPIPGFPSSGGTQGKGNDGSMGGLFPPGTFPGNTGNNGGPMSTPDPVEAAPGNQVDTAIQQAYNNYASNARMNCPGKDPDSRCEWLKKNAQYFPEAAVKRTAKAWGCRGSRWSGGNSF